MKNKFLKIKIKEWGYREIFRLLEILGIAFVLGFILYYFLDFKGLLGF